MNNYNTFSNQYSGYNNFQNFPRISEKKNLKRRSIGLGFFILGYFVTLNLLAALIEIFFFLFKIDAFSAPLTEYLLDIAASVGAVLIPGSIFLAVSTHRLSSGYKSTLVRPTLLIPIILMGLGISRVANYAAGLFDGNIGIFSLENHAGSIDSSALTVPEIILCIIAVAVVPAFAEEFAFRGIVMGSLRQYGNAFAILVSSIMFGAMHGNTTQIVFAFLLGLIFGYIDVITDSIVPSIILHFLNNFYAVLADILDSNTSLNDTELFMIQEGISVLFCVAGLISFIYLVIRDKKLFSISDTKNGKQASVLSLREKLRVFFINPGAIICLCVFAAEMIYNLIPGGVIQELLRNASG